MIVGHAYPSDDNDLLKAVQHDLYARNVSRLFDAARTALVQADEVLGTDLLIAEKARAINSFDHRVLQDAHDIMAAAFRYGQDDGGHHRLFESPDEQVQRYRDAWLEWFAEELRALASSPRFVQAVVQAVLLANSELGYAAERAACSHLVARYRMAEWGHAHGYVKTYRVKA